jgi:hypothetical protein
MSDKTSSHQTKYEFQVRLKQSANSMAGITLKTGATYKSLRHLSMIAMTTVLMSLSACSLDADTNIAPDSGVSSSGDESPNSQVDAYLPRTTLGTRALEAKNVEVDTSNATSDWQAYEREAEYEGVNTQPLRYITLESGKRLAIRVTLPRDAKGRTVKKPLPVILTQTAYNTNLVSLMPMPGGAFLTAPDPYMVKRGYAMVAVDVLGTGSSEGGWEMIGAAEQEGYSQVIDWITEQPWSDGNIGVAGISYMGITALLSAAQAHPAVKAAFCMVPLGDAMRGTAGTGGVLNGLFMSRWLTLTQILTVQTAISELQFPFYWGILNGAQQEHIDQIDAFYLPVINKALSGDPEIAFDGEFWKTRSPIEQVSGIKAPTLIIGSLHDIFQRDEPLLYEQIKQYTKSKLIIYDGDHASSSGIALAGVGNIPPATKLSLQWFDEYVRGMDTGIEDRPNVTQFVKNHSKAYTTTTDWPHPQIKPERWYLDGNQGLSLQAPNSTHEGHDIFPPVAAEITVGKTSDERYLSFNVSPKDGSECSISYVQWTLGMEGKSNPKACFSDNTSVEKDALNYESAPMEVDYYINGPIQADLWIESSVTDAVISVRIDEVSPDGSRVEPLTNGLLIASMRAIDETRSRYINNEMIQPWHPFSEASSMPLNPGEVTPIAIEVFPTSAIIRKGYKLRISINASNQAQGVLNDLQKAATSGGVTTIHASKDYPSSILLPKVPLSSL